MLKLDYKTTRRRPELCVFKFEDISEGANGKPAIRLDFSKTYQFGMENILPINQPRTIRLIKKMEDYDQQ